MSEFVLVIAAYHTSAALLAIAYSYTGYVPGTVWLSYTIDGYTK